MMDSICLVEEIYYKMADKELTTCVPCQSTGMSLPAVKFCTNCNELLCRSCVEFHNRLKLTKNHDLIDCNTRDAGTYSYKAAQLLSSYMVCPSHGDKTVEFMCKDHSTVCCPSCATINHRMCQHVVELRKLTEGSNIKGQIDRFRERLVEAGSCIAEIVHANDACRNDLRKSKEEISNELERVKSTLLNVFDKIKVSIIEKVNSLYVDENREESWKRKLESNAEMLKMFDDVTEIGTDLQMLVVLHKMKDKFSLTEKAVVDQGHHVEEIILTLKVKDAFQRVLQTELIEDLVAVETVQKQVQLPETQEYIKRTVGDEATLTSDTLEECSKPISLGEFEKDTTVYGMYIRNVIRASTTQYIFWF